VLELPLPTPDDISSELLESSNELIELINERTKIIDCMNDILLAQ
jgi:hypothetical protein